MTDPFIEQLRLIHGDDRMLALWDAKSDTFDIARAMGLTEGFVESTLWRLRNQRRGRK